MTPYVCSTTSGPVRRGHTQPSMPLFVSSKRYFAVYCSCPKKRAGKAPTQNYLGAILVKSHNEGHFHCSNCNSTYRVSVDKNQIVHRSFLKGYQPYTDQIACIDSTIPISEENILESEKEETENAS